MSISRDSPTPDSARTPWRRAQSGPAVISLRQDEGVESAAEGSRRRGGRANLDAKSPERSADPAHHFSRERRIRAFGIHLARWWVVLAAAAAYAWTLAREVLATPELLPQWDMAKRGLDGLRLAASLRAGEFGEALAFLNEMSVWPPFFALLETPVFLLFGESFVVPRLLVVGLFALAAPTFVFAARALDPEHGTAVGWLAAGLLLASPFHQLFAALVMLEIPGVLLLTLCLGLYGRAVHRDDMTSWRWLAWSTTALFFCKPNYGLMWLLPLAAGEARRRLKSWSAVLRAVRQLMARGLVIDSRRPARSALTLFLGFYGALLAVILIRGEVTLRFAGHVAHGETLGGPVYALYLLGVLVLVVRPRRSWRLARTWLTGLSAGPRQLALWTALPIALWMLIPEHTKGFFVFVQNRSSEIPLLSFESLAFYPRVLANEMAPATWLGWGILVLAAIEVLAPSRGREAWRIVRLGLLVAALALVLHPYKLPRFAATVTPLAWLAAAHTAMRPWRGPVGRRIGMGLAAVTFVALVGRGIDFDSWRSERLTRTAPAATMPVLDTLVMELEAQSREGGVVGEDGAVVGLWNLLSPGLLEWRLRQRDPGYRPWPRDRWEQIARARSPERLRRDVLERDEIRWVIFLDVRRGAPSNTLTLGFRDELTRAPELFRALREAGFRQRGKRVFAESGYRLRVLRRDPS